MRLLLAAALASALCVRAAASDRLVPPVPPLPPPVPGLAVDVFRADMQKALEHVCQTPVAWRTRGAVVQGIVERLNDPPEGLHPRVAAVLPRLAETVQKLAERPTDKRGFTADVSELLYGVGKLSQRGDIDNAVKQLDWLFGTYFGRM